MSYNSLSWERPEKMAGGSSLKLFKSSMLSLEGETESERKEYNYTNAMSRTKK